jgi:hypothetical protein
VAVNLGYFQADYASVDELVHDPDGPVGQLIAELSERAAVVAREAAHVFPGTGRSTVWNPVTSTAMLPSGVIRESVRVHLPVRGSRGGMYGGVNVLFQAVFLEFPPKGSVQMYDRYPFMTTGLDSLIGTV